MFDFFKRKEEKRQEQIAAYIDQQMSPAERSLFDVKLKQDADLQAGVEAQQEIKLLLRKVPKLKAPRNFVLDPAVYGGKAPAPSFIELLYPKMRVATAAVSFMFVILLGVGIFQSNTATFSTPQQPASDVALLPAASEEISETSMAEAELMIEATPLPNPTIAMQQEKVEIMADDSVMEEALAEEALAEEALAEEEMAEEADEVAMSGSAADSESPPASAPMPENGDLADAEADNGAAYQAEEAVSPRIAADEAAVDGERVGVMDSEPAVEATQPPAPQSTAIAAAPVVTDEAETMLPSTTPSTVDDSTTPWGTVALWFFGLLTLTLISATAIIRRKID